jgi:hypothetical protein
MQILLGIITKSLDNYLLFSGGYKKIVVLTAHGYGRKIWNTKYIMATYPFKYQLPESFFCQKTKFANMVHCT